LKTNWPRSSPRRSSWSTGCRGSPATTCTRRTRTSPSAWPRPRRGELRSGKGLAVLVGCLLVVVSALGVLLTKFQWWTSSTTSARRHGNGWRERNRALLVAAGVRAMSHVLVDQLAALVLVSSMLVGMLRR